ncbi:hypothetical protein GCM10010409_52880 [Mycolicibacterium diernhoferi]
MATAPPASRAVTAAVGVQPASMSAFANGPDRPKANADVMANSSPSWNRFVDRASVTVIEHLGM